MTGARRRIAIAGAAAGALVFAALIWYPRAPVPPAPRAEAEPVEAPYRQRDFTPAPGAAARVALADAEARARARETPTKLAPVPEAPRAIPVGPSGPPAPERTMTKWIGDYRDAVCSCKTRSCVGDLQAQFLSVLDSAKYDKERDQEAYVEASRQAIRCYNALPES